MSRRAMLRGLARSLGFGLVGFLVTTASAQWVQPRSLAGGQQVFSLGRGPGAGVSLAVDPTDPDRLYLVYHDTDIALGCAEQYCNPLDSDVNIYMQVITRVSGNLWRAGPRILVADDTQVQETDQFMPSVVVDDFGRIHVVFYDDRRFPQDDLDSQVRFDVWYAYSTDGGQHWVNLELFEDNPPGEPAVDSMLTVNDEFELRDYIGIAVGSDRIWTCFMGMTEQDVNTDKSVIWSSQILWP